MAGTSNRDKNVNFRVLCGGKFFMCKDKKVKYKIGETKFMRDVDPDLISKVVMVDMFTTDLGLSDIKEMWYLVPGKTIHKGLHCIETDKDAMEMLSCVGKDRWCHIYVIQGSDPTPVSLRNEESVAEGNLWFSLADDIPPVPLVSSSLPIPPETDMQSEHELGSGDEVLGSESSDNGEEFDLSGGEGEEEYQFDVGAQVEMNTTTSVMVDGNAVNSVGCSENVANNMDVNFGVDVSLEEMAIVDKEGVDDSGGFDSCSDSDESVSKLRKYKKFNPIIDFSREIKFQRGMLFSSSAILRRALKQHAVECGADFYFLHNDRNRISVLCPRKCDCPMVHARKKCTCEVQRCGFKLYARRVESDGTLQVKSFQQNHECGRQHKNQKVTSLWLADKYLEEYRADPNWKLSAFISAVQRDHKIDITYIQAWRARFRANMKTQGDSKDEYAKVWDYAATIRNWNPGSSAFVKVSNDNPEKPIFERLYVCLNACKEGFLRGCRPVIGLDGCHLRGAFSGQILVAVGQDGNKCIYPIAFAVVEAERKDSWYWFLDSLLRDVGDCRPTFMSDRQKGLIEALNQHNVAIENTRVCVRHLYNNFKKKWSGLSFKDAIWAAARSYTQTEFERHMEDIKRADEGAYSYLMSQDPCTWSRHGFSKSTKSDMLLNNICESFNSCILPARDKSILSMAEWIRHQLMRRFVAKREGMKNYVHKFTPNARKLIEASKIEGMRRCQALWGGEKTYEVNHFSRTYVVDIDRRSCTCLKWDLTGIPCPHAISAILKERLHVEDYVNDYYLVDYYLRAYSQVIHAMPGQYQLDKSGMVPPLPPKYVIQPGRPKKNARRREPGEEPPSKTKKIRISQKRHCKGCGQEGHYKNKCTSGSQSFGRPANPKTVAVGGQKRKYTKSTRSTTNAESEQAGATTAETEVRNLASINQDVCSQNVCSKKVPNKRKSVAKKVVNEDNVLRRSPRRGDNAVANTAKTTATAPLTVGRSPIQRTKTTQGSTTTAPPSRSRKAWK